RSQTDRRTASFQNQLSFRNDRSRFSDHSYRGCCTLLATFDSSVFFNGLLDRCDFIVVRDGSSCLLFSAAPNGTPHGFPRWLVVCTAFPARRTAHPRTESRGSP